MATSDEYRLFAEAIAMEDEQARLKWLDVACGGDLELRGRVARLMESHLASSSPVDVLSALSRATREDAMTRDLCGTHLGPYKLLQMIGEGGMGLVYMAEQQEPLRRRVALKLIRPGMDTRHAIARFDAERQALARMDHPNIARVLDAGETDSGKLYFVMELVQGLPITEFCDHHQFSTRDRCTLFQSVCHGVQHAHQRGIIHRDLKPSNVLVTFCDGQPLAKIIDFGVAKAVHHDLTERSFFTEFGHVIGTLDYMSPEQATLDHRDIDYRADIYALGGILYELLTGEPPFDRRRLRAAALDEVLRIIRDEEPPFPSKRITESQSANQTATKRRTEPRSLFTWLKGDADWIVLKALEKDRNRRYESAAQLADDLSRCLNDEPIVARPPSRSYRLQKFARKHRVLLLTFVAIACTLALGIVTTAWQARVARQERDTAIRERLRAERQVVLTEKAEARAIQARRRAELETVRAYEVQAFAHDEQDEGAIAALWFAYSSKLSEKNDARRSELNLRRAQSYLDEAPHPVLAFQASTPLPRVQFDPSARYLLVYPGDSGGMEYESSDRDRFATWEIASRQPLRLPFEEAAITGIAWNVSGDRIAIASREHAIWIGSFPSLEKWQSIPDTPNARTLTFSPDGKGLAFSVGKDVRIWNLDRNEAMSVPLKHERLIRHIDWSPDSSKILTLQGFEASVYSVNATTDKPLFEPVRHFYTSAVWPLFGDSGKLLVTVDTHLRYYDTETGVEKGSKPLDHQLLSFEGSGAVIEEGVFALELNQTDDHIVRIAESVPGQGKLLYVYLDPHVGVRFKFNEYPIRTINALGGRQNDYFVAAGGADGVVSVEDFHKVRSWKLLYPVMDVRLSPGDTTLLATVQSDGFIRVWDLGTSMFEQQCLRMYEDDNLFTESFAAMSADGRYVVNTGTTLTSYARPRLLVVFDVVTGRAARDVPIDLPGQLVDAAFSSDGRRIAAVTQHPNLLTIWNWREDAGALTSVALPADPRGVAYGPDHQVAVLSGDSSVALVHDESGLQIARWQTAPVEEANHIVNNGRVRFSPDGRSLVTYGYTAEVWDLCDYHQKYAGITHGAKCHDVDISRDGHWMASGGYDHVARVRDFHTGEPVGPVLDHPDYVYSVCLSPDGQRLLTSCRDGGVRLWDWKSGRQVIPTMRHRSEVFAARLLDNGQTAISLSFQDKRLCLWDCSSGTRLFTPVSLNAIFSASLLVSPDENHAVISGTRALSWLDITRRNALPGRMEDVQLRAELASGHTIEQGGLMELTAKQWLDRWQMLQGANDEYEPKRRGFFK